MSHLAAFLCALLLGVLGGGLYDFVVGIVYPFRMRALTFVAELLFCILFAGVYLFVSVKFSLPPFRFYLFLGCAAGFFLYLKSVHKLVAFLARKGYNKCVQEIQRQKEKRLCRKTQKGSRRKKQSASQ